MVPTILAMLDYERWSEQLCALEAVTLFLENATRGSDEDGLLTLSLTAMNICLKQNELRAIISGPEMIFLLEDDRLRASYSTVQIIQKIVAVLRPKKDEYGLRGSSGSRDVETRHLALQVINICLKHYDIRDIISGSEMVRTILAMLDSNTLNEHLGVLEAVILFLKDDILRKSYSRVEIAQRIVAVLSFSKYEVDYHRPYNYGHDRSDEDQQLILDAMNICLNHREHLHASITYCHTPADDLRAIISGPEMTQKVIAMLDSRVPSEEQSTLEALSLFLKDDLLRPSYSTVGIVEKLLALVKLNKSPYSPYGGFDSRQLALNAIDICLTHNDSPLLTSTTQILEHILTILTGGDDDKDLLDITKQLIARNKDDALLIWSPLTRKPLQQIAQSPSALWASYIKTICLLPISITIPRDEAHNLISRHKNPDASIVEAASHITHFTANDKFRHYFLHTGMWNLFTDLLRRQQGPKSALQMLAAFAGHDDTRALIMNPKFGIINELLSMLKAGSSDFDRWGVGLQGLLALGVFQL
ncbi:hypothetical protein B0H13DRAFT_2676308 [Mycena leptocephala]|nr:hypothetical protein B0H13DRAFT_2676308 [Mycena leptocephala]